MKALAKYFSQELPLVNSTLEEILLETHPVAHDVIRHIVLSGGKRLRPLLLLLFAANLGYRDKSAYKLAVAFELIHSGSLLHDDVLDQAVTRRRQSAAHLVFGVNTAILGGDILFTRACRLVAAERNFDMINCFAETMERTIIGEVQEIEMAKNPEISLDDYLEMITGKTAYLIQACCQFGVMVAGGSEQQLAAASVYGLNIGIAFQLVDDAIDYSASEDVSGKPQGGDLREGKLTLPLILYLQDMDEKRRLQFQADLRERRLTEDEVQRVLHEVNTKNYPQQTRERAQKYLETARRQLEHFPQGEPHRALQDIVEYVLQREK